MKEFCPHCGAALPADAEFCPNCGQARPSSADATNPQSTTAPTTNTTAAGEQGTTTNTVYLSNVPYNESPQPGLITSTQLFYRDIFKIAKRMGRADYWWAILGSTLIGIGVYAVIAMISLLFGSFVAYNSTGSFVLAAIYIILLLIYIVITGIATITAQCRRFYDLSYSGAFWLLNLIPMVGSLVVFIFMVQSSKQLNNPY